jgi:hypothetical protein
MVADVHYSQVGTKATKLVTQKAASSIAASTDPPNMDEIVEAEDFTVVTNKKKLRKSKATPDVTETAMNTPLPPSPSPETSSSEHNTNPFLTAVRQKILPIVVHHHFQGYMTILNKDFHTQFQPIGSTTYRMKVGITCQTTTYKDYPNRKTFLKQHKVPFNLIKPNGSKPYRVVIKGISPTTPPKAIQDDLFAIEFNVQNVIPMTAWSDRASLTMHIVELGNVPHSQKISQLNHLCYIRITVEPYKGRTVPPQCAQCQQFYHVAANCQAPPVCGHCTREHCSWQCDKRFEPNFVPVCALCKMGEHCSKYRGCPYFRNLMEKETGNKPQPATPNSKQLNRQSPNRNTTQTSFQS